MDSDARSTSSPERSLSNILKGRHRKQTDESSSLSLPDNDNISVERGSLLRSSIDRGIGKLKDRTSRHTSTDPEPVRRDSQDSATKGRKLSMLVSSPSRRRRKKTLDQVNANGSDPLGLYLTSTDGSLKTVDALTIEPPSNKSAESLPGRGTKSAASSLLTEDSDPESATRPTLTSRDSHAGYLTLSSPLITTQTVGASSFKTTELTAASLGPHATSTPPLEPSSDFGALDYPSGGTSDAEAATVATEARGRPLGDAVGDNSAVSAPTKARNIAPLEKINVTPVARADSPNELETPSTLVTPPTPDQPHALFSTQPSPRSDSLPAVVPSFTPSFAHRRVKSASIGPSKLSVASTAPLTPALEEVKTPGGTLSQPGVPSGPGGFFSSLFSTTQNAVNQISHTFAAVPGGPKGRSVPTSVDGENIGAIGDEEVIITNSKSGASTKNEIIMPEEPAVATLGSGNLLLSHLGISESSSEPNMTVRREQHEDIVQFPTIIQDHTITSRGDDAAAVEGVNAVSHDKIVADGASSIVADRSSIVTRPKSASSAVGSLPGDATPPRSIANGAEGTLNQRSGSVRSRISDRRKKHRNNSTYSGSAPSAIAAALAASHSTIANPAAKNQRHISYPPANQKRNKDFHALFKSVPEEDCLVEDYSAALQRDILLQGRLYISEKHICFSSNIIGWITTLVISFDEIVSLEKKYTAMIFPNAIVVQTLHAKNTFASLINRDGTYELLLGIWKAGHPNLKATEAGHVLDSSVINPPPEAAGSMETDEETEEDDDDYDDDADENEAASFMEGGGSAVGSDTGDPSKAAAHRVVSVAAGSGVATHGSATKGVTTADVVSALDGFPGPTVHAPTECGDQDSHYDKICLDDIIPAPLGKVYSMLFGPLSGSIMRKFLEEQESGDIQYDDDKKGIGEASKTNSYSFIMKLSKPFGPKQTKCIVDQNLDAFDLEKAISVTCSTHTPDVPGGGSFVTKTRYCLMWAPNNSTRLLMSSTTEWSAKSFLRGTIDKQADTGQQLWGKDLAAFLKAQIAVKSPAKGPRVHRKGRKKKTSGSPSLVASIDKETAKSAHPASQSGFLGALETIRGIIGPVGDIVGPLVSTTTILYVLLVTVTFLWLRQSYTFPGKPGLNVPGLVTPQRLAAYEEIWRREENELWNWLEDRISLDDLTPPGQDDRTARQQTMRGRDIKSKLDAEQMNEREIDDAIRVTEERLDALKAVIEQKKLRAKGN